MPAARRSLEAVIDTAKTIELSPYVFGHNLEHTRACVYGGLSAQMLKNRKFAGKPSKNEGCPAGWFAIGGEHAFFDHSCFSWDTRDTWNGAPYTHHLTKDNRMERINEIQCLDIQNLGEGECGIGQGDICIQSGVTYELRVAALSDTPVILKIALTDRDGEKIYAQTEIKVASADWTVYPFEMVSEYDDGHACLKCTVGSHERAALGMLSMMAAGHFRGMRRDVVEDLKSLGVGMLRWPGGCYAADYRWQDMFLPADERAPLQSHCEIETQPFMYGFDNHEIDTDDFIALCREIGAEPFITVNLQWDDPQSTAAWVEYCNGSADTPYGRRRAERGHPKPYNVRFWSLGNELGYFHAEGPKTPESYAAAARQHALAMRAVSPDIELVSSGPLPDIEWAQKSAVPLKDVANYAVLHNYQFTRHIYNTPDMIKSTYESVNEGPEKVLGLIKEMRQSVGEGLHISFDEWNYWYAWYRTTSVTEGMFTAGMLHMLIQASGPMDMPICCYFQPVAEGAIEITPLESRLTASGQVFGLMSAHKGGRLCALKTNAPENIVATVRGDKLTVTLYNKSYDSECAVKLRVDGEFTEGILLSSESVLPHSRFEKTPAAVTVDSGTAEMTLPPHSVARLSFIVK